MNPRICRVRFLPEDRTAEVEAGKTLLEAAVAAGVHVNSICGGDGVCGKCRLILREGEVSAHPTTQLTREEINRGYLLACQTTIVGDITVDVPPESQLVGGPRLTSEDAQRFGGVPSRPPAQRAGRAAAYAYDPLCWKEYLDLAKPTPEDNQADQERLFRELRRRRPVPVMQMGLSVLKQLADTLRSNGWSVTATLGRRGGTTEVVQIEPGNTKDNNYGVAVDIGTTTVVAHLVDLNDSRTLGTQATYNSQIQYGEDVIARIAYARASRDAGERLGACVADDINNLISALVTGTEVRLNDVNYVVCAGNTTMMHFLMGLQPANIPRAPYIPAAAMPPVIRTAEVGVKTGPRGLLAWMPAVSSYVGGDVVGDVLVSGMNLSDELSLLIDMGTNGELVLGNKDWLMCCSASAGPAFEGGGITCGTRATRGAIERVVLAPGGDVVSLGVIGGGRPIGLCGSGLIDLVAELLRVGLLDRGGAIHEDPSNRHIRRREGQVEFVLGDETQDEQGRTIVLTQADVQNFIRAKGAIYHAAECLLQHVGMSLRDVKTVYVSGGFGNYLDVRKAVTIGLLPDLPASRFRFIGNGSLQGARMVLLSQAALEMAEKIAQGMTYFELSTDPCFMNEYTAALFLPHTDVEKFPSVVRGLRPGKR